MNDEIAEPLIFERLIFAQRIDAQGKQELIDALADYGETMTALRDDQWVAIAAFLGDDQYFKERQISRLVIKARARDLRGDPGRLRQVLTNLVANAIIIPISGWLMSSAMGFQTVWFGVLPLPDLVGKNKVLADQLHEVHENLNYGLLLLLLAHVGGALKHHFIERDDGLARMIPFLRRRT